MGTIANPNILTNSETVSFDSTTSGNFYSFTINDNGNVLFSGSSSTGFPVYYNLYDNDYNKVDTFHSNSSIVKILEQGTYYLQASNDKGGTFSVTSNVMSGNAIDAVSIPIIPDDTNNTQIENFVERFYTNVLERGSDESGLQNWSSSLENSSKTADDIANGFFHSTEFVNKNTNNSEFVDIIYRTLLGREADSGGKSNWINALENGSTRDSILDGFIYSNEFETLAQTYGINVGTLDPEVVQTPLTTYENQTEVFDITNIQELTLNSIDNPMYAEHNTYKIPFSGTTYLDFETIHEGTFKIDHGGYGYSEPKITIYDNDKNVISDYSTLDAGKYTIKVYNDKNPDFGAYISILSPYFKDTTVYEIPDINGFNFESPNGFSSFFELNLDENSNLSINGGYQDIYLYDNNLDNINLNIDNHIQYIEKGEYNILFNNHTIYPQPFELLLS